MIKIQTLFDAYQNQINNTPNVKDVFSRSGMDNRFRELDLGFFPLGSGMLNDKTLCADAEIQSGGVMVLGNDFGTVYYVDHQCINNKENNSSTIKNLQNIGLDIAKTFFTNFYLGLRDNINHPKMTMTHLAVKRAQEYKDFCLNFFHEQLKIINPRIVICLGKDVKRVLYEFFPNDFPELKSNSVKYTELFKADNYIIHTNNVILGERKFIFIPHPSYAHINWTPDIKEKINAQIVNTV